MIQQPSYLQMMGIQQWVRRGVVDNPKTTESVGDKFSSLIEEKGSAGSTLLIVTTTIGEKDHQLFDAMLKAIDLEGDKVQQMIVTEGELFSQPRFQRYMCERIDEIAPRAILQLGGDALQHDLVEFTYHPSHLLHHPADKRHAWEVLKRVQQRING